VNTIPYRSSITGVGNFSLVMGQKQTL